MRSAFPSTPSTAYPARCRGERQARGASARHRADFTLISPEASGLSAVKLRTLTATKTTGANGEYVKARADLRLAERHWIGREILVMDLSEASKRLGTHIDGFLGQDVLREFSSVRIDYKKRIIELEE